MSSVRIKYQTFEFEGMDIHLKTLRDLQQFHDEAGLAENAGINSAQWPMFGVVWDSGNLLAHLMSDQNIQNKRILEVGCGLALASHVLNHRQADITATDHHHEAGNFLSDNTELNQQAGIPFVCTGWEESDSRLGKFDLIIGSDLLYESNHPAILADFIDNHANPQCEVILIDPGRKQVNRFSKILVSKGFSHSEVRPSQPAYIEKPFKGKILRFHRLAII